MGSRSEAGGGGGHKSSRLSLKNPPSSQSIPRFKKQKLKKKKKQQQRKTDRNVDVDCEEPMPSGDNMARQSPASTSEQLGFFLAQYQSANGIHLSSLELDSIRGLFLLPCHLVNTFPCCSAHFRRFMMLFVSRLCLWDLSNYYLLHYPNTQTHAFWSYLRALN